MPIALLFGVACLTLGSPAHACGFNGNMWQAFSDHVDREYWKSSDKIKMSKAQALAYGHALGRLALAVGEDPEKRRAYDCVDQLVDTRLNALAFDDFQNSALLRQRYQNRLAEYGNALYKHSQEAAMGMKEREIATSFGVQENSPLDVVFAEARRRTTRENAGEFWNDRRTSSSTNTNSGPFQAGQGGGTSRSNSGSGGPWSGGFPGGSSGRSSPIGGTPSTSVGGNVFATPLPGADPMCAATPSGHNSLAGAATLIDNARNMTIGLRGNCTGSNWTTCRTAFEMLYQAEDDIIQVFQQNYDGLNKCRKCNFADAKTLAARIVSGTRWLTDNYYGNVASTGHSIYRSISDNMNAPLCSGPISGSGGSTPSGGSTSGIAGHSRTSGSTSGSWVLTNQRIDRVSSENKCSVDFSSFVWDIPSREEYLRFDYTPPPQRVTPGQPVQFSAHGTARMGEKSPPYAAGEVGFSILQNGRKVDSVTIAGYNKGGNRGYVSTSIPRATKSVNFPSTPSDPAKSKLELIWTDDWCSRAIFEYTFQP